MSGTPEPTTVIRILKQHRQLYLPLKIGNKKKDVSSLESNQPDAIHSHDRVYMLTVILTKLTFKWQ